MDGVIVDFHRGIGDLFNLPFPYENTEHMGSWDAPSAYGIPSNDFWDAQDYHFWANLKPMPDGLRIIELLENYFGQDNICILSSPIRSKFGECVEGKVAWLQKYLPQYSRRFLFGKMKSFCASPNSYLVDDYHKNVKMFREAGGHACLIPRAWSMNYRLRHTPGAVEHLRSHLEEWF